ncbi:MAG: phage Gp37/Gp68 family protein [Oscillospiraceae bacterium]|nr:phage Gp37/Gp68 family protein [Oscillospiraceae bacterium]
MHDIWNPWHGCRKCSEGCQNCYMYYLDGLRGKNGADIYRTKAGFRYPLSRDRHGNYKVRSGEMLRVCMTSDFFLEEADPWRPEAWDIIRQRPDVKFFLLTKRPERVENSLPPDWGKGWENVMFNVTCENQRRADERLSLLLSLPFKHKGVMCAPMIGPVSISDYLTSGQIEQVLCDGENYGGARPCHYEWVKALRDECVLRNVTFVFCSTGRRFVKDGKLYKIEDSGIQTEQAFRSGLSFRGKAIHFELCDSWGYPIPEAQLYRPHFGRRCRTCGMQISCNGCSDCGKCEC